MSNGSVHAQVALATEAPPGRVGRAPLAASVAERVGTIMANAERVAEGIGAEAEAEAYRCTEAIEMDVGRLARDQLAELANVRTELAGATESVELQFDRLIARMRRATDELRRQDVEEGRIEADRPPAGEERTSVRLTMSERRDVSVTVSRERSEQAAHAQETAFAGAGRPLRVSTAGPAVAKPGIAWWRRLRLRRA